MLQPDELEDEEEVSCVHAAMTRDDDDDNDNDDDDDAAAACLFTHPHLPPPTASPPGKPSTSARLTMGRWLLALRCVIGV